VAYQIATIQMTLGDVEAFHLLQAFLNVMDFFVQLCYLPIACLFICVFIQLCSSLQDFN